MNDFLLWRTHGHGEGRVTGCLWNVYVYNISVSWFASGQTYECCQGETSLRFEETRMHWCFYTSSTAISVDRARRCCVHSKSSAKNVKSICISCNLDYKPVTQPANHVMSFLGNKDTRLHSHEAKLKVEVPGVQHEINSL
jgi:hypothetical protein